MIPTRPAFDFGRRPDGPLSPRELAALSAYPPRTVQLYLEVAKWGPELGHFEFFKKTAKALPVSSRGPAHRVTLQKAAHRFPELFEVVRIAPNQTVGLPKKAKYEFPNGGAQRFARSLIPLLARDERKPKKKKGRRHDREPTHAAPLSADPRRGGRSMPEQFSEPLPSPAEILARVQAAIEATDATKSPEAIEAWELDQSNEWIRERRNKPPDKPPDSS